MQSAEIEFWILDFHLFRDYTSRSATKEPPTHYHTLLLTFGATVFSYVTMYTKHPALNYKLALC